MKRPSYDRASLVRRFNINRLPVLSPARQRERESWQYRCIEATRANQTMMGCIILRILNKTPRRPPFLNSGFVILEDGRMIADMHQKGKPVALATHVCNIREFVENLRWLADDLKLVDKDREALFAEARKTIIKDYRATSNPEEFNDKLKAAK